MLDDIKIDELLDKVDSRYTLVLAAAKRARQINEYTATLGLNDALGIPGPQVHTRSQHPLTIAIEELRQDKLRVDFREPASADGSAAGAAGDGAMDETGEEREETGDGENQGAA
ncbi:MAG: DNA-directed RNA polymerase subunit omega [Actinomycetota bacterium]